MKLTKKILVAVLTVALIASCFMFSTFAEDTSESPFHADGITKIDDILEYYICEDYLADAFEDGIHITEDEDGRWIYEQDADYSTSSTAYYKDFVVGITEDPNNAANHVLKSELPFNKANGYTMQDANKNVLTDKIFLTMKLYFEEDCNEGFEFSVKVGYKANGKTLSNWGNLFKISFKDNTISYTPWRTTSFDSSLSALQNSASENVTPKTNTWYSLTLSFNADDDVYYLELVEEGGEAYKVEFEIPTADGVWGFLYEAKYPTISTIKKCATEANPTSSSKYKDNEAQHNYNVEHYADFEEGDARRACYEGDCRAAEFATYYIDEFEIYEGSYTRKPSQIEEITRQTLIDLEAIYLSADSTRETKFLVAEVLGKLYNGVVDANGDYISRPIDDSLKSVLLNAEKYMNETFANEIILRAEGIDAADDYYSRLAYVTNEFEYYNGLLCANDLLTGKPGISTEIEAAVVAAREKYAAEKAVLDEIKAHSEGFITAVNSYVADNKEYDYIVEIYNEVEKDEYKKRDSEYIGMAEATEIYDAIVFKYDRMVKDIKAFVDAVSRMETYKDSAFGALYAGYVDANKSYTKYHVDAVINPDVDNSTYAPLAEAVDAYEALASTVVAKSDECNTYNDIVKKASIASYYPSLCEILLDADAALEVFAEELDYRMDYPGIADSKALHETLTASLDTIVAASNEYIAAVNAIANATTLAEKQTAIAAANELKAAGDNLGVEGVKEANLILTAAEAEVNIAIGNSQSLITVVNKLADASTLSERKALILEAEKYVPGVTEGYAGVNAALAALNAAKVDFEADVAAFNQALANAAEYVVTLS